MNPRSLRSGSSDSCVHIDSTEDMSSWASCGRCRKSFTTPVSSCSCTLVGSSWNVSANASSSSPEFSIRSEYSPTIQIRAPLASGSSRVSSASHSLPMIPCSKNANFSVEDCLELAGIRDNS